MAKVDRGHAEPALGIHRDGTADVLCWCEANVVQATVADVRAGRTGSCSPLCKPGCPPKVGERRGRRRKVVA